MAIRDLTPQNFIEIYTMAQQYYKHIVGRSSYDTRFCMTLPCSCLDDLTNDSVPDAIDDRLIRLDVDPEVLKKYAEEHPLDLTGVLQLCLVTTTSFVDSLVNGSVLYFTLYGSVLRITEMYQDSAYELLVQRGKKTAVVADYVVKPN